MKVAVAGATGAVGREMVKELEQSKIDDIDLELYASPRSQGKQIEFRSKRLIVQSWDLNKAKQNDYILMSAGGSFSKEVGKPLADAGCTVIDNSSAWRMDKDVPLIVPEVNGVELKGFKSGIIANPNCSTIQMVLPLKILKESFGLEMVQVATYQSVSGSGQQGMSELATQVEDSFKFRTPQLKLYPQQIAFNVLPAIGPIDGAGHCQEEEKMVRETRKILNDSNLAVFATTARVPVINCHSEALVVKLGTPVDLSQAAKAIRNFPGLVFDESHDQENFPTPLSVVGDSKVHLCRMRLPLDEEKSPWLQFWVVADNLKKGAATNAVQILEYLHK